MSKLKEYCSSFASYFSLFTSTSTLMCCALPSLLVALGAGGVLASVFARYPQIGFIAEYSSVVFTIAGVLIVTNVVIFFKKRNEPCDIQKKIACTKAKKVQKYMLVASVIIYLIALFAKYQ